MSIRTEVLVVDGDARARSALAHGLQLRGYEVATASTGLEGLAKASAKRPSVILAGAVLPDLDVVSLCERLKDDRRTDAPIFLLAREPERALAQAALAHGADDVLALPIHVSDVAILARIASSPDPRAFEGDLSTLRLPYLLRALCSGERGGRIAIEDGAGRVLFRDGMIVDAHYRHLHGEPALLRMLTLLGGPFEVEFEPVFRRGAMDFRLRDVLLRGFTHVRRWEQIVRQTYPLDARLELDFAALARELAGLPDAVNRLVRLFDGRRTLLEVIDGSEMDDLTALEVVGKLDSLALLQAARAPVAPVPAAGDAALSAADAVFAELFGDTGPGPAAPLPAQAVDWFEEYVKGEAPWSRILRREPAGAGVEVKPGASDDLHEALAGAAEVSIAGTPAKFAAATSNEVAAELAQDTDAGLEADAALTLAAREAADDPALPPAGDALWTWFDGPDLVARAPAAAPDHPVWEWFDQGPAAQGQVLAAAYGPEEQAVPAPAAEAPAWSSVERAFFDEPAVELGWIAPVGAPAAPPVATRDATALPELTPLRAVELAAEARAAAWAEGRVEPAAERTPAAYGLAALCVLLALLVGGTVGQQLARGGEQRPEPAPSALAPLPPVAAPVVPAPAGEALSLGDPRDTALVLAAEAQTFYDTGRMRDAVRLAEDALSLQPGDATISLLLGLARFEAGDLAGSIWALERSLELEPGSARPLPLLGAAYQELGDTAAARRAYERYLQLEPQGSAARDVRAILSSL